MTNHAADIREITAAIVREKGSFELGTVLLEPPRPDELVVRIVATGLCHTDLVVRDQLYPVPLPIVLGHEGAGVVAAVGSAVTKVAPGDHVALSFLPCRQCRPCLDGSPASCANFNEINFAGERPDGSHALSLPDGSATLRDDSSPSPHSRRTRSPTRPTRSRFATTRRWSCSARWAAASRPVPALCGGRSRWAREPASW